MTAQSGYHAAIAAFGASCCAAGVALGAWAAHGAELAARSRLDTAALYLLLHGIALVAMAPQLHGRARPLLAATLALGTLLFSGSLVGGALFGVSTRLAPVGGSLLIIGWLGWAAQAVVRRRR